VNDISKGVTSVVVTGDTIMVALGTDAAAGWAVDASGTGTGIAAGGIVGADAGAEPTAGGDEARGAGGIAVGTKIGVVAEALAVVGAAAAVAGFVWMLMKEPNAGSLLVTSSSKSSFSCKRFRLAACWPPPLPAAAPVAAAPAAVFFFCGDVGVVLPDVARVVAERDLYPK